MTCDCDRNIRELIEKHIRMNKICVEWSMMDDDIFETYAHVGAITGLQMLLNELNGEVEY